MPISKTNGNYTTKIIHWYLKFVIDLDQRAHYTTQNKCLCFCSCFKLVHTQIIFLNFGLKMAGYYEIAMLPFGRAIAFHGSPFDVLCSIFLNSCIPTKGCLGFLLIIYFENFPFTRNITLGPFCLAQNKQNATFIYCGIY